MADVIGGTPRYVYLRLRVPRDVWLRFVARFATQGQALASVRLQWDGLLSRLVEPSESAR